MKFSLDVERKQDGTYIITSEEIPGLLLSSQDLDAILGDVTLVMAKLEQLDGPSAFRFKE